MDISPASMQEFNTIISMYQTAQKELRENDIHQWDRHDPSREMIREDIENGNLFVAKKNNQILGSIVLDEEHDPEHAEVNWLVPEQPTLYLHRLVVHPDFQGEGTGKELMKFADDYAAENGYTSIRLDAYEENEVAQNLYQRFGYKKAGEVYFPRRDVPFYCYEKEIPFLGNNSTN